MNKVKKYFKDIRECEKLERRSSKEWKKQGNFDEAIRLIEFKERKAKNTSRIYLAQVLISGGIIGSTILKDKYKKHQGLKELKELKILKEKLENMENEISQ